MDALLFLIAAINPYLFTLANVLRDITIVVIAIIPLCFIIAGEVINEGEEIAIHKKRARMLSAFVINFALAVVMLLADSIKVYDITQPAPWPIIDPATLPPTVDYVVNFDTESEAGSIGSAMILVFVGWYAYSVILMFVVQRGQAGVRRVRARRIMAGVFMIPAGIVYFILLGYLHNSINWDRVVLVLLGHVIWMLSPVLVYLGMRLRVPSEDAPVNLRDKAAGY
jgi:hypothetical protein